MKPVKIILAVIIILLIVFCIGLYVYGITVQNKGFADDIKLGIVALGAVASLCKLFSADKGYNVRHNLKFFEKEYGEHLRDAFAPGSSNNDPKSRKKLLCAARYYNDDKLKKAADILVDLAPYCRTANESYAVRFFTGLVFSDAGFYEEAASSYENLVTEGIATATVYNNLGHIYLRIGNTERMLECFENALHFDPENSYAYNNFAQYYFREYEFDRAIEYAEQALKHNANMYEPATLLATIYSIRGDDEKAKKYKHKAIANGQDPERLNYAIELFKEQYAEDMKNSEKEPAGI